MSTVERPLTSEMRKKLAKAKRDLRIMSRWGGGLSGVFFVGFKIFGVIVAITDREGCVLYNGFQ